MERQSKQITDLIGKTPCLRLKSFGEGLAEIWAKLEMFNPGGSIKDRAVLAMIEDVLSRGAVTPNSTIVEATSGNTGISLAMICASKGLRCVVVMPDSMSVERRKAIAAFGAELVLTDGKLGMAGAVAMARSIIDDSEGAVALGQFENPANALAHERTTGPELIEQMSGRIDALVLGIGTGGTITGIARSLLKAKISARIIGVEPAESAVLSGCSSGEHGIEGIGAGFVPALLDRSLIDAIVTVDTRTAAEYTRLLAVQGIFVGISSGAALAASIGIAAKLGPSKNVVTIFPDGGFKYLSKSIFS